MSWYLWHDSWSWFLSSSGTQENGISHLSKGCDKNNNFLIRSSGRQMFICLSLVCLFHFCIPGTCLVFPCLRLMKKGCRPWIFDFSSFLFFSCWDTTASSLCLVLIPLLFSRQDSSWIPLRSRCCCQGYMRGLSPQVLNRYRLRAQEHKGTGSCFSWKYYMKEHDSCGHLVEEGITSRILVRVLLI